jgi:prepilin-type N-terminal cleavage/methylation domain-containing protein
MATCQQPGSRTRRRASAFSLLEMMLVLALMALIMAMALPSLRGVLKASRVDTGASMVAQEVRLGRQRAITTGQYVAVLLPTAEAGGEGGLPETRYRAASFRSCYLTGAPVVKSDSGSHWYEGSFAGYVERTRWRFLPRGVFLAYYRTFGPYEHTTGGYSRRTCNVVSGVLFPESTSPVTTDNVRALIFRPDGSIMPDPEFNSHTTVAVQAAVVRNDYELLLEAGNYVAFEVNRFTGKVHFLQ